MMMMVTIKIVSANSCLLHKHDFESCDMGRNRAIGPLFLVSFVGTQEHPGKPLNDLALGLDTISVYELSSTTCRSMCL